MRKKISFQIEVPEISDEILMEWLRFKLGETGGMSLSNPLVDTELEAVFCSTQIEF